VLPSPSDLVHFATPFKTDRKTLFITPILFLFQKNQCSMPAGAYPAHRPVGPGLQIFGLITLPLVIIMRSSWWGELKELKSSSVGEDSAY